MKNLSRVFGYRWTVVLSCCLLALAATVASAQAQVQLKFWHNQSLQSIRHEAALLFAKRVDELTQGKVKIEVFGGGVMGDSLANMEGMKVGSNHFTVEDPGLYSTLDPTKRVAVVQLPYLFDTYEQAWEFMDSDLVKEIYSHFPKDVGFRMLAVWENGIRQLTNNKRAIQTPKDMEGLKIRVVKDPVMIEVMKAMGASPVPMAFIELYTAMQHGVVDGQENPITNIYFAKFYEVQKYISLTAHQYSSVPLMISEMGWKKLTPDQQEAAVKAAHEAKWLTRRKTAGAEDGFLKEMVAKGLVVNKVDSRPFREAVAGVYRQFEPVFGKELVKKVLDGAAAVREKHPKK